MSALSTRWGRLSTCMRGLLRSPAAACRPAAQSDVRGSGAVCEDSAAASDQASCARVLRPGALGSSHDVMDAAHTLETLARRLIAGNVGRAMSMLWRYTYTQNHKDLLKAAKFIELEIKRLADAAT